MGLQRLFAVALSDSQCFHHLDHFPMIIPDSKNYQQVSAPSTKELYCITLNYETKTNNDNPQLLFLYEDGTIQNNEKVIYKIDNNNHFSKDDDILKSSTIRHIACIEGNIMWYNSNLDIIETL